MAYTDINTPVIEKIKLPSGNSYFIADRQLRDVVDTLSQTVAGGVSYSVAWDGTSAPTVGQIPQGVVVNYDGTDYTGTLSANSATPGAFYLVKSGTQVDGKDVYDEYVPVGSAGSKTWEKIGDTQISLADVVTSVSLSKSTDTVIGSDATFTITQPTVTLSTGASGSGTVAVATGISSASASGAAVSASGDNVTVVTGYNSPSTAAAVASVSPTTKKLVTTTITGVSGNTTASKASTATAQVTADGTGANSTTNTDWLKGISVSSGVLTIGAATMTTQSTPQYTFTDVTVPTAASATTVATGTITTAGAGDSVVTSVAVGDTINAITSLGSPSTDTVIGTASTFNVTQPTISVTASTTAMKATASGANTAWNSKDTVTVLTSASDISVTKGSV